MIEEASCHQTWVRTTTCPMGLSISRQIVQLSLLCVIFYMIFFTATLIALCTTCSPTLPKLVRYVSQAVNLVPISQVSLQLSLEWSTLTKHTGNQTYSNLSVKSLRHIANLAAPLPGSISATNIPLSFK